MKRNTVVVLPWWMALLCCLALVETSEELPKFSQLKLLYPGYYLHDGSYRDNEVIAMVGGNHTHALTTVHNTSPLRLSWTLNRYGGRHAVGEAPVENSERGLASVRGGDGQEYVYRNVAFGPFLALKYGEPLVVRPQQRDVSAAMETFKGRQGIIQFLSYGHHHTGGHIGLWDCDHIHQARDWTSLHHIISIQLWETPDSYCSPKRPPPRGEPAYVTLSPDKTVYVRRNFHPEYYHDDSLRPRLRHHKRQRKQGVIWTQ